MVGFVTFDSAVHYYTIKAGSRSPQQLAVADLDEPFVPAPEVRWRRVWDDDTRPHERTKLQRGYY